MSKYLIFFSILALAFSSCDRATIAEDPPAGRQSISEQPNRVKVYTVKWSDFDYLVQSTGKVKAFNEQRVIAENSGTVSRFHLRNSAQVRAGSTLLGLDTRSILLKIEKAKESIFSNQLNYRSDLLSQESLLRNKSQGLRDTIYRKLRSNVGLTNAELELRELQLELSKANIVAPFTGTIADVKVQKGQYIRSGDELFTIYSHGLLYLEIKVLEGDVGSLETGQRAEIVPIAKAGSYRGIVEEINPLVDKNGLVMVRLRLLETGGLLPGMNAVATIMVPVEKSLTVPKSAVVMRNERAVVFSFEDGLAKWNYVQLGRDNGRELEIRQGLKPGQQVIISNNLQLANDAPVKVEK